MRDAKIQRARIDYTEKKLCSTKDIESANAKPYLTIKEACLLLGACDSTVRKLIKQGTIKTFFTGGKHLIRRQDLDTLFIEGHKLNELNCLDNI